MSDRRKRGAVQITREALVELEAGPIKSGLHFAQRLCHEESKRSGWYNDATTGQPLQRNLGEMLCLIHSEISEAMEGERKNLKDGKLPHRLAAEVELADALIRIFDYAGYRGFDLSGAVIEKLKFNASRADHKPSARAKAGGKRF